jgi:hypothetical protein
VLAHQKLDQLRIGLVDLVGAAKRLTSTAPITE